LEKFQGLDWFGFLRVHHGFKGLDIIGFQLIGSHWFSMDWILSVLKGWIWFFKDRIRRFPVFSKICFYILVKARGSFVTQKSNHL